MLAKRLYLKSARFSQGHCFVHVPIKELLITAVGCLLGLGSVAYLAVNYHFPLLVASFGATSLLLYGTPSVPMAQPRNVIGGHVLSAMVGVTCYQLLGCTWISITLAATLAILLMLVTGTAHPPGGATALVAVMTAADYSFIILPILVGSVILVTVAIFVNYFSAERQYPVKK